MIYLDSFDFPTADDEVGFFMHNESAMRTTYYPFQILAPKQLSHLDFDAVTILYGGNGSGKTTALNIIAEKLFLGRDTLYNRSDVFEKYTALCSYEAIRAIPRRSRIITSDDVFDAMLSTRGKNQEIDAERGRLLAERENYSRAHVQLHSMRDYEELKKASDAHRLSAAQYVKRRLGDNVREHSNGENAFKYFVDKIDKDGLYLLDEPENSLSPALQQELVGFLADSARFYGCQLIIATHSPFVLAMPNARVYDMDSKPPCTRRWSELPNVRAYYDFFMAHQAEFE